MSKTLSANLTAGKSGSSVPVYLVALNSKTTQYRWSTLGTSVFPTTWTGPAFAGNRLAKDGLSAVTHSVDLSRGGNYGNISGFKFKVVNADLYWNTLVAAGEVFYNQDIELRLIFADETDPAWWNAVPIFKGFVENIEDVTYETFTVKCVGNWLARHKLLPTRELTLKEFSELPNPNEGHVVPILYGDWTRGLGVNKAGIASNRSPSGAEVIHRDYFKGVLIAPFKSRQNAFNDNPRTVWAAHDLHTLPPNLQDSPMFVWDTERKIWTRVNMRFDGTEAFGAFISGLKTGSTFVYSPTSESNARFIDLVPVVDSVNTSGATNPTYAVDEDDSNYTVLDANGEIASYEIPAGWGNDTVPDDVKLWYWVDRTAGDDNCQIQILDGLGTTIQAFTNIGTFGSFQSIDLDALYAFTNGDYTGIQIQFKFVVSGGLDSTFRIRGLFIRVEESQEWPGDAGYNTGKGRMAGEWIDSPDHSNSADEGDLLENPVYVSESIIAESTEGLGLTSRLSGAALQFNDHTTVPHLQIAHASELAIAGALTIELWIKKVSTVVTASPENNVLIQKLHTAGLIAAPYAVRINYNNSKLRFVRGDGTTESYVESSVALNDGQWYHIVCVALGSPNTMYIYIDGLEFAGASVSQTVADSGQVARVNYSADVDGRANVIYDEIRIWNTALSEGQVVRLYNGGAGYPRPLLPENTVAWWRFDEEGRAQTDDSTPAALTTITDSSGNGNTAALLNEGNTRWKTGASAKLNYVDSFVYENGGVGNVNHSFDNLAVNKSNLDAAVQKIEKVDSREWLGRIAHEFGFAYHQRYDGRESVSRIDALGNPATITTSSILLRGDDTTFRAWRGRLTDVYNEFVLRYRRNMSTGDYDDYVFLTNPDAASYTTNYSNLTSGGSYYWSKCHTLHTSYGFIRRFELKCEHIRDKTTAEIVFKFFVDWLTRQPYYCEFEAPLALIDLELCDVRKISHPLLPTGISNNAHFRLVEMTHIPNEDRLKLVWIDVGTDSFIPSDGTSGGDIPDWPEPPTFDFDADDLDGDDEDPVPTFVDRIGDWEFNSITTDAVLRKESLNGHNTLDFNGTSDAYLAAAATLADVVSGTTATWFIVCSPKGSATNSGVLTLNDAIFSTQTTIRQGIFLKSTGATLGANNDGSTDTASITLTFGEWVILTLIHDSTDVSLIKNNNVDLTSAETASGTTSGLTELLQFGCNPAASKFFNGEIARVLVWNRVLTTDEQTLICDYLRTRYALY